MTGHLLNLRALAEESVDDYALLRFEGREAISECFDYQLELIPSVEPKLSDWIGKLCEFDITADSGEARIFAGRIYGARWSASAGVPRIHVEVRPAYHALSYARGTYFAQDKDSLAIFEAMIADVPGLTKTVSVGKTPPARGYSVRYDEREIDYLARLLARDGIMYFFAYDSGGGPYRHKMIVTDRPSDYIDCGKVELATSDTLSHVSARTGITAVSRSFRAVPRKTHHVAFNVNKLDTPFSKAEAPPETRWGSVYSRDWEWIGAEAKEAGGVDPMQKAADHHLAQSADVIEGAAENPAFLAGGRVKVEHGGALLMDELLLTSVQHSAYDPWMLQGSQAASYGNRFTAISAQKIYRPAQDLWDRRAPGPLLGVIGNNHAEEGEIVIDDQSRVPVLIENAVDYSSKKLEGHVWLPVQQQWAHGTHGAQFFPRVGTRVIVDFLYGNPDLPFIAGTVYTPSQPYPFKPTATPTQSGWRSVTEKNGKVRQEFRFEDKDGSEEIYLHTGRDYRREIDQDEFATIKRDQTVKIEGEQKLSVTKDRTVKITGKQDTKIDDTRTVKVTGKSLLESQAEIQLKVGSSTITLSPSGIEIKAPQITIKAEATLDMSGGAMATLKAPKTDVTADAMLTLKGGIVMIN
jgi:type VI secretion system secreted protein VgrG